MNFNGGGGHFGFPVVENFAQGWQRLGIHNGKLQVISFHHRAR